MTQEAQRRKYRLCLISSIGGGEYIQTELTYDLQTGEIVIDEENRPNDKKGFIRFFQRNINILDLQGKHTALSKQEFMQGSLKIPFVYDLLRAETLWQDRKYESSGAYSSGPQKKISFKPK